MNPLEIGLSFVEGLALIASPCILPVLPLVLSASVDGGRKRPFGIITGFVLAFTLFALLSRKLVMAFHIDLDTIKYGSLILLALFGLVLLSEKLSARFSAMTQRFANAGNSLSANAKDGFGSGVLIGMLIGFVWTPCAGPILAAVLVQVIRQENDVQALFLIASFALGAGVPMLIISLLGRSIMSRLGFFTQHGETVRKAFGVIILLAVAFIASGININALTAKKDIQLAMARDGLANGLDKPYPAPEFAGIEAWLNSAPLIMQSLKGKVVLVDFWTYSCINCVRTLPYITAWDGKYRDKGLVIVGVHAPEFEFEKNKANVEAALAQHHIQYPVALDNRLDTWTNFKNQYWPAHYLIDKEGRVVYTHFGEGAYDVTENNIRYLLGLDKIETAAVPAQHSHGQTPETYLGYARSSNAGMSITKDRAASYSYPATSNAGDSWSLKGRWNIQSQKITALEKGAGLRLPFNAAKIFLVLGTTGDTPIDVTIALNGKPPGDAAGKDAPGGALTVSRHTLYELIDQHHLTEGVLELTAGSPGLEAYAFTFGS